MIKRQTGLPFERLLNTLLPMLALLACLLVVVPNIKTHAQISANEIPMWEGIEKTSADIANDEELVRKSLEITNGDRYLAVRYAVRLGWERVGKNDPNGAIRRFNQAWLILPEFPDIFWGFAIATHIRGDQLSDVERWFTRAEREIKDNAQLSADHGRVLEERQMPEKARPYFEDALKIDGNYIPAHIGMIRVAQAIGDRELQTKHENKFEELSQ